MSKDTNAALFSEIKRLRELVEKQHTELNWLRNVSETRGGESKSDAIILPRMSADPRDHNRAPVMPLHAAPAVDPEGWPARPTPASALNPNPGFQTYTFALSVTKVLGVSVLGYRGKELEDVVVQVQESQRRTQDFIPLFIIDSDETGIFRKRGYVYEYLPPFEFSGKTPPPELRAIAEQKLNLLREKWNMAGIVTIGASDLYPVGTAINLETASVENQVAA